MTSRYQLQGNEIDGPGLEPDAAAAGAGRLPLRESISWIGRRIAAWVAAAADYYTAATVYEQLSRLSDAELRQRGLSRGALGHHVSELRSQSP
jgi:hypothetical protein